MFDIPLWINYIPDDYLNTLKNLKPQSLRKSKISIEDFSTYCKNTIIVSFTLDGNRISLSQNSKIGGNNNNRISCLIHGARTKNYWILLYDKNADIKEYINIEHYNILKSLCDNIIAYINL